MHEKNGMIKAKCSVAHDIGDELGVEVVSAYHVIDFGDGVAVAGPINDDDPQYNALKLIASTLTPDQLRNFVGVCNRVLAHESMMQ